MTYCNGILRFFQSTTSCIKPRSLGRSPLDHKVEQWRSQTTTFNRNHSNSNQERSSANDLSKRCNPISELGDLTFTEELKDIKTAQIAFNTIKQQIKTIKTNKHCITDSELRYFTLKFHYLKIWIENEPETPEKKQTLNKVEKELAILKKECAKRDIYFSQIRIGKPIGTDYSYLSKNQLLETTHKVYKLAAQQSRSILISKLEALVSEKPTTHFNAKVYKTTLDELKALRQEMRIRNLQIINIPDSNHPDGKCECAPTQTDLELENSIEQLNRLIGKFYSNLSTKQPTPVEAAILSQAKEELDKANETYLERQEIYREIRESL